MKKILILMLLLAPAPAAAAAMPFQLQNDAVVDQAGRRIVLVRPFQRIVSLYGAHTENLFSLGLNKEIIGVSRSDVYPPEVLSKPVFSYHDGPEKFLAAMPDLVLIRPMIDRGYPKLIQRLEKSGIAVVSLQPGTVDQMYRYWKILGALTGRRDHALDMVSRFQSMVSRLRSLTAPIEPKKKVYFEAIHDRMKTFSPDAMAIFVLEAAGGINVAKDASPVRGTNIAYYGKEKILSHANDIDAYIAQKGAMNQPSRSIIQEEPGFSVIKAVRHHQILIVDETIVSRPTMRLMQGIQEIGRFLYPNLFASWPPDRKKATAPGGEGVSTQP